MAVSLESRVPLLDYRVVELVASIPPALKVSGYQPKRLLKEVVRPLLPASIIERRDKRPFPIPANRWLAAEMANTVRAILRSPSCLDRGVFDPDRLRQDVLSPEAVWPLINLELWFRIFVDREPRWVEQAAALVAPRVHPAIDTPIGPLCAHSHGYPVGIVSAVRSSVVQRAQIETDLSSCGSWTEGANE